MIGEIGFGVTAFRLKRAKLAVPDRMSDRTERLRTN